MPTMAYRMTPHLMVLAHSETAPDSGEWSDWVEEMVKQRCRNVLVWTDGGTPDAAQRALIGTRIGQVKATVLSESPLAKPVSTVLRWVGHDIRVYGFNELDAALTYAGVATTEHEPVLRASLDARLETIGGRVPTDGLALGTVRQRLLRSGRELADMARRTA